MSGFQQAIVTSAKTLLDKISNMKVTNIRFIKLSTGVIISTAFFRRRILSHHGSLQHSGITIIRHIAMVRIFTIVNPSVNVGPDLVLLLLHVLNNRRHP